MAARFWRLILLAQLTLAVAVAWRVHASTGRLLLASSMGAAALIAVPLAFVLVSLAIGRSGATERGARRGFGTLLRAVLLEAGCFTLAQLEMSVSPWRGARPRETGGPSRPVLLIHGILCNGAVWRTLARRLRAAGFGPLRALDLEPSTADIASHAPAVEAAIRDLHAASGGARVAIVAHSMGGLVARAVLAHRDIADLRCIVTIATPHHGSRQARFAPGEAGRQMRCGSAFLAALNAGRPAAARPLTSIYSTEDNLLGPPESAALEGARNLELRGLGHFALLRSPRSAAQVVTALQAG